MMTRTYKPTRMSTGGARKARPVEDSEPEGSQQSENRHPYPEEELDFEEDTEVGAAHMSHNSRWRAVQQGAQSEEQQGAAAEGRRTV